MPIPDDRPGFLRRFFGGLWWLVDGSRRLVFNLLFLAIVVALVVGWLRSGPPRLQDKTVLVLDLRGALVEQYSGSPRQQALAQAQGQDTDQVALRDLLGVLDAAARDDKIGSVLLMLDDFGGAGLANLREATMALERFRKASGKKVVAWATHYSQAQYYVAAAADEVYLHPMGMVGIQGFGRMRNYYLDAFDRLGVKANVIRVGKYKNFGEPYFANEPSKETLESDAFLYDALWSSYTSAVEAARKLPAGHLMKGIDALPERLAAKGGNVAQLALAEKLVDGLKTPDELRAMLIERGARDETSKSFRQVRFASYLDRQSPRHSGPAIGVVVAEGNIEDGDAPAGAIGGRSTAALVRKAREDDDIKTVVLRVNSPGGSAFASELIRRELELTRAAGKPVVVSMGDVAASGGYWIAMAADEVIADPSTITGSIGVFGMLPTGEGLMEKLSLHTGGYATTWLAQGYDPRRPLDPRFAGLVQSAIGGIYTDFIGKAAAARKTTPDKIDAVAQGRVWTGTQALERGLVDRTGSYGDALAAAAKRAKLDPDPRIVYVERDPGPMERVLRLLGADTLAGQAAAVVEQQIAARLPPSAAAADALWPGWRREFGWLSDVIERRQPFTATAHCLCTPP
ncbi:signal peptide peptidase SppA [Ideonella sp. A 288]|uniref:signal peptide peptidase SppA n=1 Tax=Ideonella sp. A 288 TaxID=1962181 RepID=UPI000B4AAED9|nr:signal peptide peptidase SppA [Ideonella sp. A 288]